MSKKITSEKSANLSGGNPNFKMKTLALLTRSVIFATLLPPEVYAELPVPCSGGCGPNANLSFVQAGEASHNTANNTMTVTQSSDKAVLNWNSFNVSADAAVNFAQKNANSVALNRIFSGVPSKILGSVNANGQIYLINPSGILFGQSSQVNVGGLVASTLNVDTDTFMKSGIATAINNQDPTGNVVKDKYAAFRNKEEEWGEHDASQKIVVEAGASIKTNGGGNVIMVGKSVENNGNITADDGQVLLVAAEDRVYLQPSDDLALRGFLVEVDTGGTVSNTGEVKADRGNVTLAGHAVNQHGVVKATTSIDRNGSIYLQARDGGNVIAGTAGKKNTLTATRGGELSVGENSLSSIELELDSLDKAIDEQKPLQSSVKLSGQRIHIKQNASIKAHNGVVDVVASSTPDKSLSSGTGSVASRDDLAYIQMDRGASIDVQGADASLEMARNFVTLELYSSELKDSPLQRNGILRGEEITVDIRKGTPLADISAAIAAIPKSLAEHAAKGGTVNMISQGSVVLNEGAKIDVSGGETTYQGGFVSSTKLLSNGRVIDISDADPNLIYDGILGVYTRNDRKNGVIYREGRQVARRFWESGYKAGNDAGAVNIAGYNMLLGADINSAALVGRYQTKPDTQPMGGKITIGLPRVLDSFTDNLAPSLVLSNAGQEGQRAVDIQFAQIESAFKDETLLRLREQNPVFTDAQLADAFKVEWAKLATQTELSRRFANATGENNRAYLNVDNWVRAGAQKIDLNSNGTIELAAEDSALLLARNSTLSLNADRLVLNRSIAGAGAKLSFRSHADIAQSVRLSDAVAAEGIALADGLTFDVSGEYLNDFGKITQTENRLYVRNGGAIAIKVDSGETLRFGAGDSLLAEGGAYVSKKGKVADGKGGTISLDASALDARYVFSARPIEGDNNVSASDGLVLSARALRNNGSLTLAAEGFEISDKPVSKTSGTEQQTSIASADATGITSRSDLGAKGNQLNLTSAFFEDGAFSDYRLKASRADVIIDAGTDIDLVQRNLVLTDASSDLESAAALRQVSTVDTLDPRLRKAVNFAIAQKTDFDADLVIGSNAS
ncbi:MAG TPA: filamentous hemagglutinin N-terminal domain-containing protein, partial [Pseudomonadales bacterium]|nr:filamentous hemagglutinin N-terminal domain-containing protein [Pseudomonadales bacterium]